MFWGFFKLVLAVIYVGLLAVACVGGEDGAAPASFMGDRVLEDETDPIADEGYISISSDASGGGVTSALTPRMMVQCRDEEISNVVYVIWGETLGATSDKALSSSDRQSGQYRPASSDRQSGQYRYVEIVDWRVDDDGPQGGGRYTYWYTSGAPFAWCLP